MPKKPKDQIRVPLNVLVAPVTKESITGIQNETNESQGEIIDRAVALLALGEEIAPKVRKKSRREKVVEERAKSDVVAQAAGREDIDYSDTESGPATNVATLAKPSWSERLGGQSDRSLENWRANRKPLLKPKEQRN